MGKPLENYSNLREEREDFYVEELSDYALNKEFGTFTLKVLKGTLDALNKTKRSEARYALLVELEGEFIELSYFKDESDALYTKRKFRKITRLAFSNEFKLSVTSLKDIE